MKKVLVQQIQPVVDGPIYGQVSNPADFVKSENYAHDHTRITVRDFLIGDCGDVPQVAGFEFSLIGGLGIRIFAPGQVVDLEGRSFELIGSENVDLQMDAADDDNARKDLIYLKLESDAEANSELRPFVRLRTQEEFEAGVAPYAPSQFNQPTELHTRAVVMVRSGEPSATPTVPDAASDELPLYVVTVNKQATILELGNVLDVRDKVRSLRCAWKAIDELTTDVNTIKDGKHRHKAQEVDIEGNTQWSGQTVQDFIDAFALQDDENAYDPLTQPEIPTPELAPAHVDSGKLGSVGALDVTTPVVDIPVGRLAIFSNITHKIEPSRFPAGLNARIVNKHVDASTQSLSHNTDLSLSVINSIQSDGGGEWQLQGGQLPSARTRAYLGGRTSAPRDARYIEIMGGAPGAGDSAWYTFDTQTGNSTPRTFTGVAVPLFYIRGVFSCGDGINVIVAEQAGADGGVNGSKLNWYKVNCVTSAATLITGAPGYTEDSTGSGYSNVIGDLIAPNIVLILVNCVAISEPAPPNHNAGNGKGWIYHVDTGVFEQITPIGQDLLTGPFAGLTLNEVLRDMDLTLYKSGQAVLFRGRGAQTWIFDYPTRTWTRLNIAQPTADVNSAIYGSTLWGATLGNVNGKPQMVSETSSVWELIPGTTPQWRNIGLPAAMGSSSSGRSMPGLTGMLQDGLPKGAGWLFGGRVNNTPKKDVWKFIAGGIIETQLNGVTALTLGGGATVASFAIDDLPLSWQVAKLITNPRGVIPPGSVRLSYSFDGGDSWQDIQRDQIQTILSSDNPATRKLRITLIGAGSNKPILQGLSELFETTGGPGLNQVVLRYNADLGGVRALYIDRAGVITNESTVAEGTPDKCLLQKVTPQGPGVAPAVKDYINQRLIHRKFGGTKSGGIDPVISNQFPRRVRFVQAFKIVSGAMLDFADPTIAFDTSITITGLSNTEGFRLEVQA